MERQRATSAPDKDLLIALPHRYSRACLCIGVLSGPRVFAAASESEADANLAIVDKYVDATQVQQESLRGLQMEVNIDAKFPSSKNTANCVRCARSPAWDRSPTRLWDFPATTPSSRK